MSLSKSSFGEDALRLNLHVVDDLSVRSSGGELIQKVTYGVTYDEEAGIDEKVAREPEDPNQPANTPSDKDSGSSLSEDDGDSSSMDSNSSDTDDYDPKAKRRSLRIPATQSKRTSSRSTRSGGGPSAKDTPASKAGQRKTQKGVQVFVPERRTAQTPSRKAKATQVTSPYFDQPSTGRSRRSQK